MLHVQCYVNGFSRFVTRPTREGATHSELFLSEAMVSVERASRDPTISGATSLPRDSCPGQGQVVSTTRARRASRPGSSRDTADRCRTAVDTSQSRTRTQSSACRAEQPRCGSRPRTSCTRLPRRPTAAAAARPRAAASDAHPTVPPPRQRLQRRRGLRLPTTVPAR